MHLKLFVSRILGNDFHRRKIEPEAYKAYEISDDGH